MRVLPKLLDFIDACLPIRNAGVQHGAPTISGVAGVAGVIGQCYIACVTGSTRFTAATFLGFRQFHVQFTGSRVHMSALSLVSG